MDSLKLEDLKLFPELMKQDRNGSQAEEKLGMFQFKAKIVWFNAIGFLMMHLTGLYGLFYLLQDIYNLHFGTLIWVSVLIFLGGEGITIGAHRLWTHRSYKANIPMQLLLMTFQTLAGQNCCYIWARDHRQHHKYSDTDADPHNARRGFFFSHIGWLMMKKHPDVISKGKGIDMSDLEANPIVMFQKKYYKPLYILTAMIIPIFTPVYFWNEDPWRSFVINFFSRYILLLNITWSVNSVAHIFGTRPYDQNIVPVESTFVSFIGLGEGWHNYHHAFPWDYKASEYGMKLNGTRWIIEQFAKIGWAYDLREASHGVMKNRIRRCGDGTHPVYAENAPEKDKEELVLEEYRAGHKGKEEDSEDNSIADSFEDLSEKEVSETTGQKIKMNTRVQKRRNRLRHG